MHAHALVGQRCNAHSTSLQPQACAGRVAGQRYEMHSTLSPPNTTWVWHPAPTGFAPLEADTWLEVLHKGGIEDEHVGAWFLQARGSGIWLRLGTTIAFDDHEEGWRFFGVANLTDRSARNEAMSANASAAGYDSIQFVRHTCPMMYPACLNTSLPDLTYFNLEVVITSLEGIHPCASASGSSPRLRTGWPQAVGQGATCTCNNSAGDHLHCAEVAASVPGSARWLAGLEPGQPAS